jgi:hypothetical protein
MTQTGDSSHISQRLEYGRMYLESLAKIASQLENAKEGLTNSAYLNSDLEELPPGLRKLWESLDKNITSLSAQELVTKLVQLEDLLAEQLTTLMPLIEKVCSAEASADAIELPDFRFKFKELSRLASTSLAIRILARRKRYNVPPASLPVRASELRERAEQVKSAERTHKLRVITQMRDMVKVTTTFFNEATDAATKSLLRSVLQDLQANARHLGNGGSFRTLPAPIEAVEISGDHMDSVEPITLPHPPPEIRAEETKSSAATAARTESVPQGFSLLRTLRQLRLWIMTPFSVSWREAGEIASSKDSNKATRHNS